MPKKTHNNVSLSNPPSLMYWSKLNFSKNTSPHFMLMSRNRADNEPPKFVDPHSGRRVVSLSKIHLPLKSTGNTQEAVAPSNV